MAVIAVLGYGTVGSGVVEVMNTNKKSIESRTGQSIDIKYVLDLRDFPDDPVQKIITHNYDDILNDESVEVVVEVMGGINPAYTFVKSALKKGKSVCTSNKELVAAHGAELMRIAKENNVNFLYEASVGGGIRDLGGQRFFGAGRLMRAFPDMHTSRAEALETLRRFMPEK